jgi:hypothetical protein
MRSHRKGAPPGSVSYGAGDSTRTSGTLGSRRRLGPVEWWLIAVIIVAVAITVAMAIFNPS